MKPNIVKDKTSYITDVTHNYIIMVSVCYYCATGAGRNLE